MNGWDDVPVLPPAHPRQVLCEGYWNSLTTAQWEVWEESAPTLGADIPLRSCTCWRDGHLLSLCEDHHRVYTALRRTELFGAYRPYIDA